MKHIKLFEEHSKSKATELVIEVCEEGDENPARYGSVRKILDSIGVKAVTAAGYGYYGSSALKIDNYNKIKEDKRNEILSTLSKLKYFKDLEIFERPMDMSFKQQVDVYKKETGKGMVKKKRGDAIWAVEK